MKYCNYCGNELHDEAVMCPNCKKSLISNFIVTVQRSSQFLIGKSTINFEVDGKDSYSIESGESKEIELSQGMHTFYFHAKARSKTINVDLKSNMTLLVEWDRVMGGISVHQKG